MPTACTPTLCSQKHDEGTVETMGWMHAFIVANLIGIGANLDNCGVGIAYGSKKIRFPHWVNAIVNAIGFVTALLGAYVGEVISWYISPDVAAWAACIALCIIGLFFWYSAYVHPRISTNKWQMKIERPGWKQGVMLGWTLSLTNVASGFGVTISNTNSTMLWIAALTIALWGYIAIWIGNIVGIGVLSKILGKYSSLIAGLLLIVVGIHQVLSSW